MSDARLLELFAPGALFRTLADQSPIMLWAAAPDGECLFFSRAWLVFRGRTLAAELCHGWVDGIHDEDRASHLERRLEAVRARQSFALDCRLQGRDDTYHWVREGGLPWFAPNGDYLGCVGTCAEITDRRQSDLAEDQLRQLAARLQIAREEERAQVARELHDELGQTLTALKLDIGRTVQALTAERLTPAIIDRVQSLVGLSDIALATVKRIATKLRPPTLDHLGLAEAMHWEALAFKARTGLRCNVRTNRERPSLTAEQQTALFRIFQEALTNIVRHAQASAVQVTLTERAGRFELHISDNGRGITDRQATDPQAIGLVGMRERAALVGGQFTISGRRGKGTVVSIQVPVLRTQARVRERRGRKAGHASR